MADKITFKMESISMDKEIRDWFEDLIYDKIKVETKKNGEGYAMISEHEFLVAVQDMVDRYSQKYGVDLITDENWWYLRSYPHEVVINNCVAESHARNFYMTVLEKFIDYVMSISEGYVLR